MFEILQQIVYPKKCAFCNMLISEYYTCKKCEKNLEYICASNKIQIARNKYFDFIISSYFYTGIIRRKILEFKFENKKYLYKALSQKLLISLKAYANMIDYVVYVPISLERYFERGYNQSKLIAKFLSNGINKPLLNFVLLKNKNNKKQSKLSVVDRKLNVRNVYKIFNKRNIYGKTILLVDDIFTTGATVNECSKILKQCGVSSIIVATIAKAELKSHTL